MSQINLFEVGPRDGLQNEARAVSFEQKLNLVKGLLSAGVKNLELGAFVHPQKVPQMADTERLFEAIETQRIKLGKTKAWSLVPNLRGLERALKVGAKQIAVFTATSETFNQKNIGMSVKDSLDEIQTIVTQAHQASLEVRGYVSTVWGCPFEGKQKPKQAQKIVDKLFSFGVSQVSLGDTIGVGVPTQVSQILRPLLKTYKKNKLAVHFHDTRGTALANVLRALDLGITVVDSSVGGLGGCPFAPGAAGNLATEDLLYMLHQMGFRTGIDLDLLCKISVQFQNDIGRPVSSRYLTTLLSKLK